MIKNLNITDIPIYFYIITALSADLVLGLIGGSISLNAKYVIYWSVIAIAVGAIIPQAIKWPKLQMKIHCKSEEKIYKWLARILMATGIICVWINFALIWNIPLVGGNDVREVFTESLFWNAFIFCSLGVFVEGYRSRVYYDDSLNRKLVIFYLISSVLTGWKAALINILLMYVTAKHLDQKINILKLFSLLFLIAGVFLLINFLRAGGGDWGGQELFLYMYWGFVNFSNIAFNEKSDCFYTNVFSDCKFVYDNSMLENQTWNVYTALTPIYIDGGVLYVGLYFFTISLIYFVSGKVSGSLFFAYMKYLSMYFIFIAHNGYYFNSRSGLITGLFMFILDLSIFVSRNSKRLNVN